MPNNNEPMLAPESEQIARAVRAWLNRYPNKPEAKVDVEFLGETSGLSLVTVPAAYITRGPFILGGYEAQYQFAIQYKTTPVTTNERLEADEILNDYAAWVESTKPELPQGCRFRRCRRTNIAALISPDANGSEIHQILFTLLYEVNV